MAYMAWLLEAVLVLLAGISAYFAVSSIAEVYSSIKLLVTIIFLEVTAWMKLLYAVMLWMYAGSVGCYFLFSALVVSNLILRHPPGTKPVFPSAPRDLPHDPHTVATVRDFLPGPVLRLADGALVRSVLLRHALHSLLHTMATKLNYSFPFNGVRPHFARIVFICGLCFITCGLSFTAIEMAPSCSGGCAKLSQKIALFAWSLGSAAFALPLALLFAIRTAHALSTHRPSGVVLAACAIALAVLLAYAAVAQHYNTTSMGHCVGSCMRNNVALSVRSALGLGCTRFTTHCQDWWLTGADMPPCCQRHLRGMLAHLVAGLEAHNITYTLQGPSLLGALQRGGIIPWIEDIHLGVAALDLAMYQRIEMFGQSGVRGGFLFSQDQPGSPTYPTFRLFHSALNLNAIIVTFLGGVCPPSAPCPALDTRTLHPRPPRCVFEDMLLPCPHGCEATAAATYRKWGMANWTALLPSYPKCRFWGDKFCGRDKEKDLDHTLHSQDALHARGVPSLHHLKEELLAAPREQWGLVPSSVVEERAHAGSTTEHSKKLPTRWWHVF